MSLTRVLQLLLVLRCKNLPLVAWVQVLQCHRARSRTRNSCRSTALYHPSHHRPRLSDLCCPRSGHSGMHLLTHRYPRLLPDAWYTLIGGMCLRHREAAVRNSSMTCQTGLMSGKRLRYARHHGGDGFLLISHKRYDAAIQMN